MNKILNWFFGSFFRTLGRLLVFILLGYLLFNIIDISSIKLPNLFSVLQVNALENIDIFADYNLSDSGMFWNITTNGETQKGYELYTTNSPNAWYYASPTSDIPLNLNGGGMAITQCGYGILENNYYTISFVFNSNYTPYLHPFYTNRYGYIIGVSEGNTTYRNDINATDVSNNIEQIYYADGFYVDTFTIIFKANRNGSCITTTFSANSSVNYLDYFFFRGIKVYSLGQEVPTAQDIANAMSNNFNNVISNQNQNTTTIINNNNTNTNNIISNQNANTDREIESQKVCTKVDSTLIFENNKYLNDTGTISSNSSFGITDYINVRNSYFQNVSTYSNTWAVYTCFYNSDKELISCVRNNNLSANTSIPNSAHFVRASISKSLNQPKFEICKNGNQAIGDNLSDINNAITDDSPPTNLDSLNNSAGWLPAGPVDSILNLPLSFLTNLNTNLSKSCQPVNLPLPFVDKNLPLPCVNSLYEQIDGLSTWINVVGTIASAFILFGYFINLYKYVDDTLTFRENNYIDNWSGV